MRTKLGTALAVLCFAAACGNSDGTSRATQVPPTPATGAAEATPTPAPTAVLPTPASRAPTPLNDVLTSAPGEDGWHLPAGRWVTGVFSVPVEFTTPVDLILVRESLGAVWLRNPATPENANSLVLARTGFVNSGEAGSPERPVPRTAEEITAELERNPVSNLLRQGTIEGATRTVSWWDFEHVDPNNNTGFPCSMGPRCISPATTIGGEQVIALVDEPTRVYQAGADDLSLGVWVTGDTAGHAGLLDIADHLVASIRAAEAAPPDSSSSLSALGLRGAAIPAGAYATRLGPIGIDLQLADDVPNTGLAQVEQSVVAFEGVHGFVGILSLTHLVDQDVGSLDRAQPSIEWPVLDLSGADGGAFAEWLLTAAAVEHVESAEIGGLAGTAYDIVLPDPVPAPSVCQRPCVPLTLTERNVWVYFGDWTNRVIHLPDAGVMVHLEARPGSTMDQLLAAAAPILDGISFQPAG